MEFLNPQWSGVLTMVVAVILTALCTRKTTFWISLLAMLGVATAVFFGMSLFQNPWIALLLAGLAISVVGLFNDIVPTPVVGVLILFQASCLAWLLVKDYSGPHAMWAFAGVIVVLVIAWIGFLLAMFGYKPPANSTNPK